ncbi:MAG: TlyA family RNA methyltransferase [Desulfatibacillaceae bacterium]
MAKVRLDRLVLNRGLVPSRQRAAALILAGRVLVNDEPRDKAGALVDENAVVSIKGQDLPYVSRGGLKLEHALDHYGLDPSGLLCIDAGASTGGFTDCLLQRGARRVVAIDVGYGQLAWSLRNDPRVRVIERTNIRHMNPGDIPEPGQFATIDVSFISLRIAVPALAGLLLPGSPVVCLVKPQFEVGKAEVGKGGVVRDPEKHAKVLAQLDAYFRELRMDVREPTESPILGPKGNREFLLLLGTPA